VKATSLSPGNPMFETNLNRLRRQKSMGEAQYLR